VAVFYREDQRERGARMATSNNTVNVTINGRDNTEPAVNSAKKRFGELKEMGEKITGIGMRLTGMFTSPILGVAALVGQNEKLQASLKPIQDAFAGITAELAEALIPVIKDLTPAILGIAKSIGDVVKAFAALDVGQKESILKWVLFAASLGPVLFLVGQAIWFLGTLGSLMPGLAAAVWTAVAPVAALAAAFFALWKLFEMKEFKTVLAMAMSGSVLLTTGKRDLADAVFIDQSKKMGLLGGGGEEMNSTGNFIRGLVTAPSAGISGGNTVINYQPFISTANQNEAIQALKPIVEAVNRQKNGR
jgi:hypothetical protein